MVDGRAEGACAWWPSRAQVANGFAAGGLRDGAIAAMTITMIAGIAAPAHGMERLHMSNTSICNDFPQPSAGHALSVHITVRVGCAPAVSKGGWARHTHSGRAR